jgi:hypothetical protein
MLARHPGITAAPTSDLPDVSSPAAENILLFRIENPCMAAHPARSRGAFRDRHERWVGCDGRLGAVDERGQGVRQKRVVLVPRCWDQARGRLHERRWLTSRTPGRARYKPQNHCAGKAGMFRRTCITRVLLRFLPCTRDCGCDEHPAFPAPSVFGGHEGGIARADFRRGNVIAAPVPFRNLPAAHLVTSARQARTYRNHLQRIRMSNR